MTALQRRRDQIIEELKELTRLRRGQISEQFIERVGADGKPKQFGPYYVWQASVNGKKRSVRVAKDKVSQAQEDVKGYKDFKRLCDELAEVTEKMTLEDQQLQGKKNATSRKLPSKKK